MTWARRGGWRTRSFSSIAASLWNNVRPSNSLPAPRLRKQQPSSRVSYCGRQSERRGGNEAMTSRRQVLALVAALLGVAFVAAPSRADERFIVVASTTSTQDSGLFDYLLPIFTKKTGIEVRVVAKGTGHAIKEAENGDAD